MKLYNPMDHIYVDYQIYQELKNPEYKLDKGIKEFSIQNDFEEAVMFFDKDHKYIDPERFEFEDIKIHKVLLPRFIWTEFYDHLINFKAMLNNQNIITFADIIKLEEELKNRSSKKEISILEPSKKEQKYFFTGSLRENQIPIMEEIDKKVKELNELKIMIKAKPGTGKTAMGIYLSQFFNKTLIIVPRNILIDQWKESILNFTNLKEEDIGIVEGSNLVAIKEILKNSKIILTKPQSLISQIKRNKYYDLVDLYEDIDLVVLDEAHNFGALGFSKAISFFKANNILALTATPYRKGINEFLLRASTGVHLIEAEAEVLTPKIQMAMLPNDFLGFTEKEIEILNSKKFDYIQYLTFLNMFLAKKDNYFNYLSDWVKYYNALNHKNVILFSTIKMIKKMEEVLSLKLPDKNILALTGNSKKDSLDFAKKENKLLREELKSIKEELNQKVKDKILKRKEADEIYKQEREKFKELQEINLKEALRIYNQKIKDADIIIGTFGLLREGFDKPESSHIIFGSIQIGKVSLIQSLGRITRLYEDKPDPVAQYFIPEVFYNYNKQVFTIIKNNTLGDYPKAKIEYLN